MQRGASPANTTAIGGESAVRRAPADRGTTVARIAWVVLALVVATVFAASVPSALRQFQLICAPATGCSPLALTPGAASELGRIGVLPATYATYRVSLDALSATIWALVAAIFVWRRGDDRMALFSAFTLLTFGVMRFPDTPLALAVASPSVEVPVQALRFLGSACLSLFAYLFPTGRFVPRWMALIGIAWVAVQIPEFFRPGSLVDPTQASPFLQAAAFLGFVTSVAFTQVYRYRNDSTPEQRRQTRWVVFGIVIALAGYLSLAFLLPLLLGQEGGVAALLTPTGEVLFMALVPLSIGIAILRSRLYDIDLLINRALLYSSLTLILAGVYAAVVLVAQQVLSVATGQTHTQQPLVIVSSTLLVAALFQPLRGRLQRGIDQRFYRSRYDAARTLAGFGDVLREQVDLYALTDDLVNVVDETMRPEHISLWLRPPDTSGR